MFLFLNYKVTPSSDSGVCASVAKNQILLTTNWSTARHPQLAEGVSRNFLVRISCVFLKSQSAHN